TTYAQDQEAPKKKGRMTIEQRMERMSTELKLTDEQKPKVEAVLKDTDKKMQELRGVPREERADKMKPIMEEQDKKMKDILTPDQFDKYKKMQEQMRNRIRGGGAPGAPGAPSTPSGEKKSQ